MSDINKFFIDFSTSEILTEEDKKQLNEIQSTFRPLERVDALVEFKDAGKISEDEFMQMTGVPYTYNCI